MTMGLLFLYFMMLFSFIVVLAGTVWLLAVLTEERKMSEWYKQAVRYQNKKPKLNLIKGGKK